MNNELETIVLENGLTLYLYQDLRRHSTFFQFNTYCGGLTKHFEYNHKEYHLQDGIAHILEHYIVECNPEGNFLDKLGQMQMSTNASTAPTITNYYFEAVENVEFGIQTILEGIHHVLFDQDKLEKLKKPIYQEIRGRKDNKFYHSNRMKMNQLFTSIDYRDVGGSIEEVSKTTIKDLELLYKAFYHPKNQFIVLAGNFDKERILTIIRDFYKDYSFSDIIGMIIPYQENLSIQKKEDILYFPTPKNYYELSFKIDLHSYKKEILLDLDFYLISFLSTCFGITSTLHKELIDQKVIIDQIHYGDTIIDHFIILSIGAYTNQGDVFFKKVMNEIHQLKSLDYDKFELDKKNAIMNLILRDENIFKMISPFINNIVYYHYPYLDKVEDVDKLTFDNYKGMIHSIDFSHYVITQIKNKE